MNLPSILVAVLLFIAEAHAGPVFGCYVPIKDDAILVDRMMSNWESLGDYPHKWWGTVSDPQCMFYKRLRPRYTMKITLKERELGDEESIVVLVNKRQQRSSWEKYAELKAGEENALLVTGYQGIKIITSQNDLFQIKTEVSLCPVPDSAVARDCTSRHHRRSTCAFKCKEPLYYSIDPFADAFLGTCRQNRKWSVNLDQKCISVDKVNDLCFKLDDDSDVIGIEMNDTKPEECNFNDTQFNHFFPEGNTTAGTSDENMDLLLLMAKARFIGVFVGIGENTARTGGHGRCFEMCLRNQELQYHKSCGSYSDWNKKKLCYGCRYKYKICDKFGNLIV